MVTVMVTVTVDVTVTVKVTVRARVILFYVQRVVIYQALGSFCFHCLRL